MPPVLVLALLIGALLLLSWLKRSPPAVRHRIYKQLFIAGSILALVALTVTGRLPWVFALAGAVVPLVQRVLNASRLFRAASGFAGSVRGTAGDRTGASSGRARTGRTSTVVTRFLRMSLDHDSGAMRGDVLEGQYRGHALQDLELEELLALMRECEAQDQQAASVLEAYLDRMHGSTWRQRFEETRHRHAHDGGANGMTPEEAYEVLGVAPGAARDEIIRAHRRLMQKLHPDRGGSTYLAAKINQAKDLLLQM